MKNYLFALFFLIIVCRAGAVLAQPFQQGHVTLQLLDTSRNNRPVPVEVNYPALEAGEEVPLAPGQFPVLSFGHGFVMTVDAYANFSNALVPLGYIMAPRPAFRRAILTLHWTYPSSSGPSRILTLILLHCSSVLSPRLLP